MLDSIAIGAHGRAIMLPPRVSIAVASFARRLFFSGAAPEIILEI